MTRLRQAVLVAPELDPIVAALRAELGAGEPWADPAVGEAGLGNAVLPLGDQFLEVVAPVEPRAPARRHLARRGPGGYMLILQVQDVSAARARAEAAGVRAVWEFAAPDIECVHLHPADMGTIVSLDRPAPPESWRWGGPGWEERAGRGALLGARIAVPDPDAMRARWTTVLGEEPPGIEFVAGEAGLAGVTVAVANELRAGRAFVALGGLTFMFAG